MRSALAGLVLTVLVCLTGCAGAPLDTNVLRINLSADPAMLDPITYSELFAGDVLRNMYESFTELDASGNVIPALATSWEAHEDNRGFRFRLREGVEFHSGRELAASDVKWSLEQLILPGNRGGLNAKYVASIEGAEAVRNGETKELSGIVVVDDHTVDVRFDEPEVLFPIFPLFILDRRAVEAQGENWASRASAGTGPYRFSEWRRGQVVRLSRHDGYWDGAPGVSGVDYVIVPTDDTAISMYETGELDIAYIETPVTRRVLQNEAFAPELVTVPAAQIQYLGMNQGLYEPFRDIRVREAVCLALDLEALSSGLFHGAARPLAGQVTEGVAGFDPELTPVGFDPERAKRLLSDAGYPGGVGLPPLRISSTEQNRLELSYYAEQLRSVLGMPVEVAVVERGTHLSAMNAGQVAFFPWSWTASYPDGLYFLRDVWYGPSAYNRSRWQNDEFDALIERAGETADPEARYALYHEAERVLLDDWGTCPTIVRMQVALVKPHVEGATLTAFRFLPFADVRLRRGP